MMNSSSSAAAAVDVVDVENLPVIRNHAQIIGVIGVQFLKENEPYLYCISTATQWVTNPCDKEGLWLKDINYLITAMEITHLKMVGTETFRYLENKVEVRNIKKDPINHLRYPCSVCNSFNCIVTKVKLSLKRELDDFKFSIKHYDWFSSDKYS